MIKNQNKVKCNRGQNSKSPRRSNEELELSLEVEIDEEVRDIIGSPKRCASALLDVTIVKPEDVEKLYTVHKKTLKGNEVKKFINAMNLSKNDIKKIVESMFEGNKGKSSGDYKRDCENTTKGTQKHELDGRIKNLLLEADIYSDDLSSIKSPDKVNQIYTAPKTFQDLSAMFQCKNKYKKETPEKSEFPCACEHCAIVGVVTDSQKKPFATEHIYDAQDLKNKRDFLKKKKVYYPTEDHIECQHYFKYLTAKIKTLETRLNAQEEKAVPKEYFKKVITKLVTNLTKITTPSQTNIPASPANKSRDPQYKGYSTDEHSYENFKQKYQTRAFVFSPNETKTSTRPSSKKTSSSVNDTPFWKWGEEVLRPGIDIKNKIVQLLEETVKNLRWSKPSNPKSNMKDVVDEISQNLYKTIHDIPEKEEAAYRKKDSHRKRTFKGGSSVNVSYINPTQWDESQMSLILESEDENGENSASAKPVDYCKYMKEMFCFLNILNYK